MQQTPNIQKHSAIPKLSAMSGKPKVTPNDVKKQRNAVKAAATDLTLAGKISPMTAHGKGPSPTLKEII